MLLKSNLGKIKCRLNKMQAKYNFNQIFGKIFNKICKNMYMNEEMGIKKLCEAASELVVCREREKFHI